MVFREVIAQLHYLTTVYCIWGERMTSIVRRFQNIPTESLFRHIFAGVIIAFVETIFTISIVSLIFQGELRSALPLAIGIGLVSQIILNLIVALFSKTRGVIPTIQDNPGVLMAGVVSVLAPVLAPQTQLPTVLVTIMITTILTGISLFFIGQLRLGQLGRYIPYPVIGGFLAGTGFMFLRGSIGLATNTAVTLATLPQLLQSNNLILLLPSVLFGFILFLGVRRSSNPRVMPILLIAGVMVFYVTLYLTNTSMAEATQLGFLLAQDSSATIYWQPPLPANFVVADWGAIFGQAGNIATILMLVIVSLLLNISGLEIALQQDIDLNYELRTAGMANMLGGLLGGFIGYHGMSFSLMNQRLGGQSRLPGMMVGLFGLMVLVFGAGILSYVPRPLLGGLIFFLGLDFLYSWLVEGLQKFSWSDYALVWLILLTIIFAGFLIGVALGLVLTIILFVVNYSRINIFHYRSSGAEMTSNVERTAHHQESLLKLGEHIEVIELRGFIFFGTVNHLLELIRQRYQDSRKPPLRFLVLDFRRVTGIDSSAALGFQKLRYTASANDFKILLTHLNSETRQQFADDILNPEDEEMQIFDDLDRGLEWCENELLDEFGVTKAKISIMLDGQLEERGFDKKLVKTLRQYLERKMFEQGEYLARAGEEASDLYFVEIGQVSIFLELPNNQRVRLRTMQMGTIVGEVGFYLRQKRSASVIADTKVIAHRLTREALERMKTEQPQLAFELDELMIRMVAERLARNNRAVAAYSR
jgi:sulfate permease, SulP family